MRALLVLTLLAAPAFADSKPAAKPAGTIKGTVIYEGEGPPRAEQRRDVDPYCAKTPHLEDDVVVTKGKLKDVLVRIKYDAGDARLAGATTSDAPVALDQRECMYAPRVVGVRPGQKLVVKNSDGTFHNVNGQIAGKPLWNKPQQPKGPDLSLDAKASAGDVIDIVCNVHPWMHAYAVVVDHPYFAVTGDDGTFEISGLQKGTYTLEAWHPTLGTKTLTVKIGAGAKATVPARISYKP